MAQFDKASKGLLPICVKGLLEQLGFGKVRRSELGWREDLASSRSQDGFVHIFIEERWEPDEVAFAPVPNAAHSAIYFFWRRAPRNFQVRTRASPTDDERGHSTSAPLEPR